MWDLSALKSYPHWDLWLWAAWALQFALYEALGLDRVGNAVPLTWTIRDAAAIWIRFLVWLWLGWHFVFAPTNGFFTLIKHLISRKMGL